jgi:hypothetical protein
MPRMANFTEDFRGESFVKFNEKERNHDVPNQVN